MLCWGVRLVSAIMYLSVLIRTPWARLLLQMRNLRQAEKEEEHHAQGLQSSREAGHKHKLTPESAQHDSNLDGSQDKFKVSFD